MAIYDKIMKDQHKIERRLLKNPNGPIKLKKLSPRKIKRKKSKNKRSISIPPLTEVTLVTQDAFYQT